MSTPTKKETAKIIITMDSIAFELVKTLRVYDEEVQKEIATQVDRLHGLIRMMSKQKEMTGREKVKTTNAEGDWPGKIPKRCDLCGHNLVDTFVNGRLLTADSWAIMCTSCFMQYGAGFGTGKGQLYDILGKRLRG